MDKNKGVFTMAVASDLVNMHPQTLRKYERNGLIKPARQKNLRYYSQADIDRLLRIQTLVDKGLNIAGLKMVMGVRE